MAFIPQTTAQTAARELGLRPRRGERALVMKRNGVSDLEGEAVFAALKQELGGPGGVKGRRAPRSDQCSLYFGGRILETIKNSSER